MKSAVFDVFIDMPSRNRLMVNTRQTAKVVVAIAGIQRSKAKIGIAQTVREKDLFQSSQFFECLATGHGAGERHAQAHALSINELGSMSSKGKHVVA